MNDDELITVLQEQRGRVVMTTPVQEIISRGRAVRVHRHVPGLITVVGATAAAAVAVGVALSAGQPAAGLGAAGHLGSHPVGHSAGSTGIRLAAWTVTRLPGGRIRVTFREAADAARLQRTLRADGVPASVTLTGQQNRTCRAYSLPASQGFWPYGSKTGPVSGFTHNPKDAYTTPYALTVDPSALPSAAGLQIQVSGTAGAADDFQLVVRLVHASPQCTGSGGS
jgi:hypothetical protein